MMGSIGRVAAATRSNRQFSFILGETPPKDGLLFHVNVDGRVQAVVDTLTCREPTSIELHAHPLLISSPPSSPPKPPPPPLKPPPASPPDLTPDYVAIGEVAMAAALLLGGALAFCCHRRQSGPAENLKGDQYSFPVGRALRMALASIGVLNPRGGFSQELPTAEVWGEPTGSGDFEGDSYTKDAPHDLDSDDATSVDVPSRALRSALEAPDHTLDAHSMPSLKREAGLSMRTPTLERAPAVQSWRVSLELDGEAYKLDIPMAGIAALPDLKLAIFEATVSSLGPEVTPLPWLEGSLETMAGALNPS
jgi:hypothetical protein